MEALAPASLCTGSCSWLFGNNRHNDSDYFDHAIVAHLGTRGWREVSVAAGIAGLNSCVRPCHRAHQSRCNRFVGAANVGAPGITRRGATAAATNCGGSYTADIAGFNQGTGAAIGGPLPCES